MTSREHEAKTQQRKGAKASTISRQQLLTRPLSEPVKVPLGANRRLLPPAWRRLVLVGVKAVHSLIYVSVEFCVGYLIYEGLKGREERRTAIAAGVVGGESIIFLANRCRCPLTGLAKNFGAARGSVTDLYLPGFSCLPSRPEPCAASRFGAVLARKEPPLAGKPQAFQSPSLSPSLQR